MISIANTVHSIRVPRYGEKHKNNDMPMGVYPRKQISKGEFAERFWSKVDKSGDCWIWTDHYTESGYGQLKIGSKTNGTRRNALAHRISYQLSKGDIPDGMFVCHTCDNPKCVRPEHLWVGTPYDNIRDMFKKGRSGVGEDAPNYKLSSKKVANIRSLNGKMRVKEIAEKYRVCVKTIYNIINGKSWGVPSEMIAGERGDNNE